MSKKWEVARSSEIPAGIHPPTALLSSGFIHPGPPSGDPEDACSRADGRGHLAELGAQDPDDPTADGRAALAVTNRPAPANTSRTDHTADASTSSAADTETAPATCGQADPAAHGPRDPAARDHANPTAEGCANSTTDHHTDPGAEVHGGVPPAVVEQDGQSSARARPEAGFVVRVRGESASATVILPHPEQRDLLHVRWNTSMRQTSTIELTDVTSAEPRQSKRPRIPATTAETCPAARNRTGPATDDSSKSAAAGQNDLTTAHWAGSAADGNTAPTADGRAHHAAHESRDSCPDHRHDALTADGHANLDADPRTDPNATADTSLPPRGDAPCAQVEDAQNTLDTRSEPAARGSLLARTLGSIGDCAKAVAANARTNVLQLRWRAHSDERERPGPCLDRTPAPLPEVLAPPQAPHPRPATAAPARTMERPEPPTGTRPEPSSRSLLPSGRPLPDKLADVIAATTARGTVSRPPEYVLEADAAIPMCAAVFAAACKNRATQERLLHHDAVPVPNFADTRWRTSMPARLALEAQCRLWLGDALTNADASITDLPNHTGPTFACNAHFRLFQQPKRKGPTKPAIAPSHSPPPRRHNDETGVECRILSILTALAPIARHFDTPAPNPMTYSHLHRHTRLIADALSQVSSFSASTTATPIAYAAMARHGRLPDSEWEGRTWADLRALRPDARPLLISLFEDDHPIEDIASALPFPVDEIAARMCLHYSPCPTDTPAPVPRALPRKRTGAAITAGTTAPADGRAAPPAAHPPRPRPVDEWPSPHNTFEEAAQIMMRRTDALRDALRRPRQLR